jgi:hypothetical protein
MRICSDALTAADQEGSIRFSLAPIDSSNFVAELFLPIAVLFYGFNITIVAGLFFGSFRTAAGVALEGRPLCSRWVPARHPAGRGQRCRGAGPDSGRAACAGERG